MSSSVSGAASAAAVVLPEPASGIDFSSLPWNLNLPDQHSYIHLTTKSEWTSDHLATIEDHVYSFSDRPLCLSPATTSLNYGTSLWEGLKCYRTSVGTDSTSSGNSGRAVVFRADRNYERMKCGASELCLPMPSRELFFKAIQVALQKNAHLIPPVGSEGTKLYVRPMLLGTGQQLGLYPSPEFSFVVFVSPTGNYFKAATSGLNVHLETRRARACKGGMGSTKCAGNYAAALKPLLDCKQHGFMDNLFLELETYHGRGTIQNAVLQEMSAANIFFVLRTGEIVTPALDRGTILPGVTRESVLAIVDSFADELLPVLLESCNSTTAAATTPTTPNKVFASSRTVTVAELHGAVECFATGTAAELVPIRRLATNPAADDEDLLEFLFLDNGPVTKRILQMLRECMLGTRVVTAGATTEGEETWLRDPFALDFAAL